VKEDYSKIRMYTDKLLLYSFIFALILTTFFITFGDNIGIAIYHNTDVGLYIKLFAPLIPFMYVDIIIDNILKGLDAQANVMIINIIDLIVSTAFIFFFVPIFGIKGYVVSIFISEILNLSLSLNKLLKLEKSWK
jgi:stage V sporulation protein B